MDYKSLATDLVKKCLNKGADMAEVYIETSRNLNIDVRNGDIESIKEAASNGIGFRVFIKKRMAFSCCNDFSKTALENTIESAVDFAQKTTKDENNVLPNEKGKSDVEGLYDAEISNISMDRKIDLAKDTEKKAMSDKRITKSAGASYGEYESEIFIANSNNLNKGYKSTSCYFGVYVVAEKGDQKSTGGEYCSRRYFADLKSPEEVGKKAAKEAYEMLDPRMVKTQRAAVIFHPDVGRTILGGILGAVNGERVLQGASFLRDKKDKKIGSKLLTVIDDGLLKKGMRSEPFDGEGVPTQRRVIVDEGILKGFMYNTYAAKRAGKQSTGNASRGSFRRLPGIGAHNFYMKAGDADPDEIIKSTKKGLLLKGITGYGINPVNGNFSGGASGFWIENGQIMFPVKGLTVAGNAFDMFNNIDAVGTDLDLNKSFTTPTVKILNMQIGGK